MAKAGFATAALLFVGLASTIARADGDNGCEVLEELVKASVYASTAKFAAERPMARASVFGRDGGAVGSILSGRQVCGSTIEVTTRAFSESLASLGMPIGWNRQLPTGRGHSCSGHDLRQCYPLQSPFFSALSPIQLAFVHDAWKGVREAVASQMPYGPASDLSRFTSGSLESALAGNLRTSVGGRLYSSYAGFEVRPARR